MKEFCGDTTEITDCQKWRCHQRIKKTISQTAILSHIQKELVTIMMTKNIKGLRYIKFQEHCHYIGTYRGDAHSIYDLR